MKTIIFFIILWQIGAVMKKVFEASTKQDQLKDGEKDNKPAWQKKIIEVAIKIKKEIEAQNAAQSSNQPQGSWDRISSGEAGQIPVEKKQPPSLPKPKKPVSEKQMVSTKDKHVPVKKIPSKKTMKPSYIHSEKKSDKVDKIPETLRKEHPLKEGQSARSRTKYKYKGLKKAVVWKEILAKPVGLREENEHVK